MAAKKTKTLEERQAELDERQAELDRERTALVKEQMKVPAYLVAPMEQHIDQSDGNHRQEDSHDPLPDEPHALPDAPEPPTPEEEQEAAMRKAAQNNGAPQPDPTVDPLVTTPSGVIPSSK